MEQILTYIDAIQPAVHLWRRDFAGTGSWTTRAPMLALSHPDPVLAFPSGTVLHPTLLIRNTTARSARVNLRFHWRNASSDGRTSLPEMTLAPWETRQIDVKKLQDSGTIPQSAYWAQVTLSTDTQPDGIMAVASSYDDTLRYGAQTPFSDQLIADLEGGEWRVDGTHTSLIAAGNGGSTPVHVRLTFFYDQGRGRYQIEQTIAPDDQLWVNVGDLIRNQTPDKNGNTFPPGTQIGAYQLREISRPEQNLLYEGKVITDKTFGHATYGCMICCGYNSDTSQLWIVADPTDVPIAADDGVDVFATNSCDGNLDPVDDYFPTWSSSDTSILTASNYTVTGVAVGSARFSASATRLPSGDGGDNGSRSCPFAPAQTHANGNVVNVQVTQVDLPSDTITVQLSASQGASGQLSVTWNGPSGNAQIANATEGPGTYNFSPNLNNLVTGQYTGVTATWTVDGQPQSGQYSTSFDVLGAYTTTQYNSPWESACIGSPAAAIITDSSCNTTNSTLKSDFISQVNENGSGFSLNWNGVQKEAYCVEQGKAPDNDSFRKNSSPAGTCYSNTGSLSDSTIAVGQDAFNSGTFQCGDQILIVDTTGAAKAIKTVTDTCPVCGGQAHIDNYSTNPACSAGEVGNYGTGSYHIIRMR